ncbi:hypothetical protein [Streptomyces canus]|uniref:hypothetical protein n=1 Tax=Streptomyces canus TaxID=58343 RepID=UPI003867DCFD|nr:hypothetical protein OH824_22320 [Streptomyces canus]
MSFHKIAPVKKARKPAPALKEAQPKKRAPKCRPVAPKGDIEFTEVKQIHS